MKRLGYSKFHRMGRLGNMLFQAGALWGMAKQLGYSPELPERWMYQGYFKHEFTVGEKLPFNKDVCEPAFEFVGLDWWRKSLEKNEPITSISGWLQSPMYWDNNRDYIKMLFELTDEFRHPLYLKYRHLYEADKETIAITVRVGEDYKRNGNYEILPITYYLGALMYKFPSWRNYNILIFSDDAEYCRNNFTHENMFVIEENDISQLYLASICKHFILANSTFSWWASYLSKGDGHTLYPSKYYKASLENTNLRDFWPPEWESFQYDYKFNLEDVTFIIPVKYDHDNREENLSMCVNYLNKHFITNIIVGEQGGTKFFDMYTSTPWIYHYMPFTYDEFHRTRMLNDMANESDTPYIVNMDADVFIPVLQVVLTMEQLRNEHAAMVFPYDGRFARVQREPFAHIMKRELDTGYFKGTFKGTRSFDPASVGGAIFWNKEDFIYGGMENEHMISYGPEDVERHNRFKTLGYKIVRIPGTIYHLDHFCGMDSGGGGNVHFDANHKEEARISKMNNEELLNELNGWEWVNRYLSGYYEEITEGSIRSAREVYKALARYPQTKTINSIIDVSGGAGGWWKGIREAGYKGVYHMTDWKVPKHKLLLAPEDYHEYDLTSGLQFPFSGKYDMAICMEVAEHIPAQYAKGLVQLLCNLSDRILFSAAIPHQGGNNHWNEQFQSYWGDIFKENGYGSIGNPTVRELIKNKKEIEPWFRQNIVLYIKGASFVPEDYVLPEMYTNIIGSLTDWK